MRPATETDEDVVAVADLARKVIAAGRAATGRKDIRCTVSIGGFVPKPHTPFQWAGQCPPEVVDARLRKLGAALRADKTYGRSIGYRYHDGTPSLIEGLLSRGDRRVGQVILAAWRDGARFDGWSEYFSFDRWVAACATGLAATAVDLACTLRASVTTARYCRGTIWIQALTGTGCGKTGSRLSRRSGRGGRLPLDSVL